MPQQIWSGKDERQYEHVKEGELDRGRPASRAKEIAARTVNKRRRKEGRARSAVSRATGNPNLSLDERSLLELRDRAGELGIRGRSKMRKAELVLAIRAAH